MMTLAPYLLLLAATGADPAPAKLTDDERAVMEWANEVRVKEKLTTLSLDPQLVAAARAHSTNMARQKKLEHKLDGKDVEQRVLDANYDYADVGEILAAGDGPVAEFFKLWLKSDIHRAHLFKKEYREVGVGIARDDKGQMYVTVVFGVQRKK